MPRDEVGDASGSVRNCGGVVKGRSSCECQRRMQRWRRLVERNALDAWMPEARRKKVGGQATSKAGHAGARPEPRLGAGIASFRESSF